MERNVEGMESFYDYDVFVEYVDEIYEHQERLKELIEELQEPLSFVDAKNYKQETERKIANERNEISTLAAQVVNKYGLPLNRPIAAGHLKIAFTGGGSQPAFAVVEEL